MSERTITVELTIDSTMSENDVVAELQRMPQVWNACRTLYFPSGVRIKKAVVA